MNYVSAILAALLVSNAYGQVPGTGNFVKAPSEHGDYVQKSISGSSQQSHHDGSLQPLSSQSQHVAQHSIIPQEGLSSVPSHDGGVAPVQLPHFPFLPKPVGAVGGRAIDGPQGQYSHQTKGSGVAPYYGYPYYPLPYVPYQVQPYSATPYAAVPYPSVSQAGVPRSGAIPYAATTPYNGPATPYSAAGVVQGYPYYPYYPYHYNYAYPPVAGYYQPSAVENQSSSKEQ